MDDEEYGPQFLQLMWPKIIYHEPDDNNPSALPTIEQVYVAGSIVNSIYCPVERKWHMLVEGSDGQMHDVTHDQEGLITQWVREGVEQ